MLSVRGMSISHRFIERMLLPSRDLASPFIYIGGGTLLPSICLGIFIGTVLSVAGCVDQENRHDAGPSSPILISDIRRPIPL